MRPRHLLAAALALTALSPSVFGAEPLSVRPGLTAAEPPKPPDTKPADAEPADAEPADTEPPDTEPPDTNQIVEKAKKAVADALEHLGQGEFSNAETDAAEALLLTPPGTSNRGEIKALVDRILELLRQEAQLEVAQELIDAWEFDQARALLEPLIAKAGHPEILDRAEQLLESSRPPWWKRALLALRTIGKWLLVLLPYLTVLALLSIAILARQWWNRRRRGRWRFRTVDDTTSLGMGRLIAHYLNYWQDREESSSTNGLLLLEATGVPLSPHFSLAHTRVDIARELEDDPTSMGPVTVGFVAKVFGLLQRWFDPGYRQIQGNVYLLKDKWLTARLTARYLPEGGARERVRDVTVVATAEQDSPRAATEVAKEVAFKMLYSIASPQGTDRSEQADQLREGLVKLSSYLAGPQPNQATKPWRDLHAARDLFAAVRVSWPDSLEAHLYEGMALDLLEHHEQAIQHFQHVKSRAESRAASLPDDSDERPELALMQQRAVYNEAVAQLRNLYGQEGINAAIRLIDQLTGHRQDAEDQGAESTEPNLEDPVVALALAVKADATAHRTLALSYLIEAHHEKVEHNERVKKHNETARMLINGIENDVLKITARLEAKLKEKKEQLQAEEHSGERKPEEDRSHQGWNSQVLRQLEWSISNARADFYLYAAVNWDEHAVRTALGTPDYLDAHTLLLATAKLGAPNREDLYAKAREALLKCELLLPPGVETLSNLGTLFLFQPDADLRRARKYLRRVLELNPSYEYAHFRLAQTFEAEQRSDEVKEVLRECPRRPGIPEFREMYRHYYVAPRLDHRSDSGDSEPSADVPSSDDAAEPKE